MSENFKSELFKACIDLSKSPKFITLRVRSMHYVSYLVQ